MKGCLVVTIITAIILTGLYFLTDTEEDITREMPGIMYTTDYSVEEEITVTLEGELQEPIFDEPSFQGEIEITGEQVYFNESFRGVELSNDVFFVGFPERETPDGIVFGNITLSRDLDRIIGSLSLNEEQTYYFGAPGESLEEILEIQLP